MMFFLFALTTTTSIAEVKISSDWQTRYQADGSRVPDSQHEISHLEKASTVAADKKTAMPLSSTFRPEHHLGFKLRLDGTLFYLEPMTFMRKSRLDEVCTPDYNKDALRYTCVEGQRHTSDCHLFIFDQNFAEVGYRDLNIKEPYQYFCNAMPAIGTGKKTDNELLVTVQYFPIDRKLASKMSEMGSGWKRMTILVRIKSENGKIIVEQDDSCLGNPNSYEDIASARKALAVCQH